MDKFIILVYGVMLIYILTFLFMGIPLKDTVLSHNFLLLWFTLDITLELIEALDRENK
jgi:hypothetical protein